MEVETTVKEQESRLQPTSLQVEDENLESKVSAAQVLLQVLGMSTQVLHPQPASQVLWECRHRVAVAADGLREDVENEGSLHFDSFDWVPSSSAESEKSASAAKLRVVPLGM